MFNSKLLTYLYFFVSMFGGILGFSLSLFLSIELNNPFTVFGLLYYYIYLTGHGMVMVFYFLTVLSSGFFCYLMKDLSFKNIKILTWFTSFNWVSLFFIITSFMFFIMSLFTGLGISVGWTMYVPLSSKSFNSSSSLDFFVFSLVLFFLYLSFNSISVMFFFYEYFVIKFSSFTSIPIFMWSSLLSSILIYLSNPFFMVLISMLFFDSNLCTFYFDCDYGGSLILYQNLFWFWGHPEVYVLILPVFGLVSQIMECICGELYNKLGMMFSMMFLFLLSFMVWGHHMFTVGWSNEIKSYFMEATVFMSVPTGMKMFSWVSSLFFCCYKFNMVVGFIFLFMLVFTFGGLTGVFLSNYGLDIIFHDGYFVVGHFHTVLASAAMFGYLSSFFFYFKPNFISMTNLFYLPSLIFLLIMFMFMTQLLMNFHLLGLINFPSSVNNYIINYYFMFHLGSLSIIGLWISIYLFIVILMMS